MTIQVKLFGQLRTKTGQETIAIESGSEGSPKLGDVLADIAQNYSEAKNLLFKPDGTIAGGLLISIDDEAAVPDPDLALKAGSTVTLLTAISGG
ncbi:MAG: MoaD/ThiS family protein [Planctomycetes bacterium]|nr:MoaD/ThiS family protein [Planctomycetota bacterium]